MRNIFAIIVLLFFVCITNSLLFARGVEINTAKTVAKNYYYEKSSIHNKGKVDYNNIVISEAYTKSFKSYNLYYVFNFNNNGFVIVSADDDVYPIIGYSLDSKFDNDNQSDNLKNWMSQYENQIISIINSKTPANNQITANWQYYLSKPNVNNHDSKVISISPLLTCRWDQGTYYNTLCPIDSTGPAGHVLVGCVATAMAQVMYYYRYPLTGQGVHSYYSNYGQLTVDCNTNYDWVAMADNLTTINLAAAKILYHAGVTVNMDYTPNWSGAFMQDAAEAMANHFKYKNINVNYRYNISDVDWIDILKTELNAKRPILYAGYDANYTGGHAFVCDGYDISDFFHFNWGWSGTGNGYYTINTLNPLGSDFNVGQTALTNICPASGYPYNCSGTTTVTSKTGTIEDGSGPDDYLNNNDCRWLIAPPRAKAIHLYFSSFSTEPNNDQIIIYDGANTTDSILGTFSGATLPSTINSTTGEMLVRFITNQSTTSTGWRASYTSSIQPYCSAIVDLTAPADTFSDGSGSELYDYSTLCDWKINPPNATSITVGFNSFDISNKDKLRIIDVGQSPSVVLDNYSGNTIPPTKTYNTGKLIIWFYSSSMTNGQGWEAFYSSTSSNIDNLNQTTFNIFPNPITSSFIINGYEKKSTLKIFNISSQLLKEIKLNNTETSIDISDFPKGIYLLELISDKNIAHSKIIKN